MYAFALLYRPLVRYVSHQIMTGRMIDEERPECGRLLHGDVRVILKATWRNVKEMLPEAELTRLPTIGNRHNAFLAVLTVAIYHALLDAGIRRTYAVELFSDVGWKLYEVLFAIPKRVVGLITRDPQKRINTILRALLVFPFSAPGRSGYEVRAWAEENRFCTFWTFCPPLDFVSRYVERHGDRGEIEAFRQSWCLYDWAFTYAMVEGGVRKLGHYERPHTLSHGDSVCDMCWYAYPPAPANGDIDRGDSHRQRSESSAVVVQGTLN